MSLYTLFAAGLLAQFANAYTVIQIPPPFMEKNIDPIVYPGEFEKSHLHSFYGSDAVVAGTKTSAELQKGCTTAENPNDLSSYWVPTFLYTKDGKNYEPVPVFRFSAYYNLGETPAEVPIPQDLQMVAGKADAMTPDAMDVNAKASWGCESEDIPLDANGFPTKTCSTHIQQLLFFPQCVNEKTLETGYKSRDNGTPNWCPKGMKSMPQLRFSIRYDMRKALPNGWSGTTAPFKLACGPAWCSHGDFINGWVPEAAKNMVGTTKEKQHFAAVEGPLGGPSDGASCKAKDADPSHGTNNYAKSVAAMAKRSVGAWGWETRSRLARLVNGA
ncbi:uncharacterized protein J4E92_008305 [Alternaria infectoria]|uniref:uncharacterized protein n=1 Tax=Alternaria infectoria TaxID=45303 RepID=UPI00221F7D6B|nr:uncharacterized protein J4E92_008305 [Alternaria infectoria]KAI4920662.1 hypothetical protein J4E92_008305 [Alternaria infectoria]